VGQAAATAATAAQVVGTLHQTLPKCRAKIAHPTVCSMQSALLCTVGLPMGRGAQPKGR
jgi:hypothetical protein